MKRVIEIPCQTLIIRDDFVNVCNGNLKTAILLSYIVDRSSDLSASIDNTIIKIDEERIIKESFGLLSKTSIAVSIKQLLKLNIISKSPEKANEYILNFDLLNGMIIEQFLSDIQNKKETKEKNQKKIKKEAILDNINNIYIYNKKINKVGIISRGTIPSYPGNNSINNKNNYVDNNIISSSGNLQKNSPKISNKEIKIEKRKESDKPGSLEEWVEFYINYAKQYYGQHFEIDEIKAKSYATNSYMFWEENNWMRGRKPVKSWKMTCQMAVRLKNFKLKKYKDSSKEKGMPKIYKEKNLTRSQMKERTEKVIKEIDGEQKNESIDGIEYE